MESLTGASGATPNQGDTNVPAHTVRQLGFGHSSDPVRQLGQLDTSAPQPTSTSTPTPATSAGVLRWVAWLALAGLFAWPTVLLWPHYLTWMTGLAAVMAVGQAVGGMVGGGQ